MENNTDIFGYLNTTVLNTAELHLVMQSIKQYSYKASVHSGFLSLFTPLSHFRSKAFAGEVCQPGLRREWTISEITPRLCNQTHVSAALCCTLLTGQKHRGSFLSSHCNLLRDTVAATVQLVWPEIWRAGLSFSQMTMAFQLGKYFRLRHTGNCLKDQVSWVFCVRRGAAMLFNRHYKSKTWF